MDIVCDNCFYIRLFLCLYVIFISYFNFNLKLRFKMKIKKLHRTDGFTYPRVRWSERELFLSYGRQVILSLPDTAHGLTSHSGWCKR